MEEPDERLEGVPPLPEPVVPAPPVLDEPRTGRRSRRMLPFVLGVALAVSTVIVAAIGISLHQGASDVRSETKRLVAASNRAEARAKRESRSASRVDNAITALQNALTHAQVGQ